MSTKDTIRVLERLRRRMSYRIGVWHKEFSAVDEGREKTYCGAAANTYRHVVCIIRDEIKKLKEGK